MNIKMLSTGLLMLSTAAVAGSGHEWGYSGSTGPENWAQLSGDYAACGGVNQSPVNLTGFLEAELAPINFQYQKGAYEILNNGHTVQVNYKPGSFMEIEGQRFELKQFHFHAPSENHINGESYPLEAHLVHADKAGHLAVVAVMFTEGSDNEGIVKAWQQLPETKGQKNTLTHPISVNELLPKERAYYRFNGSLTTPPCSEGVRWYVIKQPMQASMPQIKAFADALGHPNNRPVQPLNARQVLQ
ncbi:carbonic anhydrase family protein [Corallincola holothuriorum]|uniref:Carbonic anhydrase n=1 Tax=Corallincola holothuriorum TaxID=2282215 RepID=A0A368N552_9GAMM|nr:carbonic anhydrase family protein [Corallincola holothuriorum]RCU44645.1 carbonic anhydrase family protein [Corallincola holothuriorum]